MRTDIAGPAGTMASNDHSIAPASPVKGASGAVRQDHQGVRSLLIGLEAFNTLRGVQGSAPTPRLDLRYLVEGSIELLGGDNTLFQRWLHASRVALARQLSQDGKEGEGAQGSEGAGAGTSNRTGGPAKDAINHMTALTQADWNLRHLGNERAPGRPRPRPAAPDARPGCACPRARRHRRRGSR